MDKATETMIGNLHKNTGKTLEQWTAIAHWERNDHLIVYRTNPKYILVSDPAIGRVKYTHSEFLEKWGETDTPQGLLLLVEPKVKFFQDESPEQQIKRGIGFLYFSATKS